VKSVLLHTLNDKPFSKWPKEKIKKYHPVPVSVLVKLHAVLPHLQYFCQNMSILVWSCEPCFSLFQYGLLTACSCEWQTEPCFATTLPVFSCTY